MCRTPLDNRAAQSIHLPVAAYGQTLQPLESGQYDVSGAVSNSHDETRRLSAQTVLSPSQGHHASSA